MLAFIPYQAFTLWLKNYRNHFLCMREQYGIWMYIAEVMFNEDLCLVSRIIKGLSLVKWPRSNKTTLNMKD